MPIISWVLYSLPRYSLETDLKSKILMNTIFVLTVFVCSPQNLKRKNRKTYDFCNKHTHRLLTHFQIRHSTLNKFQSVIWDGVSHNAESKLDFINQWMCNVLWYIHPKEYNSQYMGKLDRLHKLY